MSSSLFDLLAASGRLAPIDVELGRLVRRKSPGPEAELVALAAALVSRERGRGHSCLELDDWAGRPFPDDGAGPDLEEALPPLPDRRPWQEALARSPLVGDGREPTPLVVDRRGRLYLRRYWLAERRLARRLGRRFEAPPGAVDAARLAPVFRRLYPRLDPEGLDLQAVAAAAALVRPLVLLSGGPGTGKTTTLARVLALLVAAEPGLRIALAAPTGKAAARLAEAISGELEEMPLASELLERVPRDASTLHRLLGYRPRDDRFGRHAGRPLPFDLVVVDEASMIDLLLADALVDALPTGARLVLAGDRDQLASVETGGVFADLCAAGGGFSEPFAALYRELSGQRLPARDAGAKRADAVVELRTSYRFADRPGIGELAAAVRRGDARRALEVLAADELAGSERLDPPADPGELLEPLAADLEACLAAKGPREALERLGRFRLLAATRRDVAALNDLVERRLEAAGQAVGGWYRGRPILVTANDYRVSLFNGDLGVCWPEEGALYAWFPGAGGELRRLALARLPACETAWAMTVHKSQGSEFDRVLLVLPARDLPIVTRELLYTGVTRARRQLWLAGPAESVRAAIERSSRRRSGLVEALTGAPAEPPAPAPPPPPSDERPSGQLPLF